MVEDRKKDLTGRHSTALLDQVTASTYYFDMMSSGDARELFEELKEEFIFNEKQKKELEEHIAYM